MERLATMLTRWSLRILADQLKTCWRLGARYDLLNWESHILKTGMWGRVFERMKKEGVAIFETEGENAGCWVIKDPELGRRKFWSGPTGPSSMSRRTSPTRRGRSACSGTPSGTTSTLNNPAARHFGRRRPTWDRTRHPRFGAADLAISVIDAKQSRLQKIVSRVLELMGGGRGGRYVHRAYEVVALSKKSAESLGFETEKEFVHMQGRKGVYINVDTILAALKDKATAETKKRNPEQSDAWVEGVAEKMAIAALRFELLKQDPDKMIAFDMESSLRAPRRDGTLPTLQLREGQEDTWQDRHGTASSISEGSAAKLNNPKEIELIKLLSKYDKSIIEAGEYLNPKEVARYAHRLSSLFNEFYEAVQVNSEPDQSLKTARLSLVEGFANILRDALDLTGIQTSEGI